MPLTVPAYVIEDSYQKTGVIVVGGSNWDLSRSAVETPIKKEGPSSNSTGEFDMNSPKVGQKPCYCQPTDISYEGSVYQVKDMMPSRPADHTVQFNVNSIAISKEVKKVLDAMDKSKGVIIAGHSSAKDLNPSATAVRRVEEVSKYLAKRGIKVYFTDSFGTSRPVTSQDSLEFKNARVDIWAQSKGAVEPTN